MSLNESTVEAAALIWFRELGYALGHGPHLAPGKAGAERNSFGFGDVVLLGAKAAQRGSIRMKTRMMLILTITTTTMVTMVITAIATVGLD